MSGLYNTYGCNGCGTPTVSVPVNNCDGCIVAPTIRWGCDIGPAPGDTLTFTIPTETNIQLPNGYTYTYELFDFDTNGINSATVSTGGQVVVKMKSVFKKRKIYRLRYKIRQVNGIQSATGEVYICMRDRCVSCNGNCDPITNDCVNMVSYDLEVDCNSTTTHHIPNWSAQNVYFENIPVCISSINYNVVTNNLQLIVTAGGCVIGQNHQIKVFGKTGTVTSEAFLNFKIKDNSIGVHCPQGMIANKCTGDCEAAPMDVQVNSGIDLQIN